LLDEHLVLDDDLALAAGDDLVLDEELADEWDDGTPTRIWRPNE
jgi:hypothetical protein